MGVFLPLYSRALQGLTLKGLISGSFRLVRCGFWVRFYRFYAEHHSNTYNYVIKNTKIRIIM